MLIENLDESTVAAAAPPPYNMNSATVMAGGPATTVPYYTAPLGPRADGFEYELQNYIAGEVDCMQPRGWMDNRC